MNQDTRPSYDELLARLKAAESALSAVRKGEIDAIVGDGPPLVVRLADAEAREAHLKNVLLAIRNVNQLIVKATDTDRLIAGACENLTQSMGYHNAWIALVDPETRHVTHTAASGFDNNFKEFEHDLLAGNLPAMMCRVLETSGIVVVRNPGAECPDCPLAGAYEDRAGMCARLSFGGSVYGSLSVSVPVAFAAEDEEKALFSELADDLAYALHKLETDRHLEKAMQKVRYSEQRFSRIFKAIPDAVVLSGTDDGSIREVNDGFIRLSGYSKELAIGRTSGDLGFWVTPGDREAYIAKVLKQGWVNNFETTYRTRSGALLNALISGTIMDSPDGRMFLSIIRDITDYRQQMDQIALMGRMLDDAPASITVHDATGRFLFANRRSFAMHGYAKDEFMAINLWDLDVPETAALLSERFERIAADGEASFEVAHFRKDGTTFPLQVLARKIEWEGRPAILSIATDITEQKQAETALQMERENLRAIMAASPVGMMVFDEKEEIIYANPAAGHMFHDAVDEVFKKCGDFINCANRHADKKGCGHSDKCPECDFFNAIQQVLAGGDGVSDKETVVTTENAGDRKQEWFSYSVEPVILDEQRHAILALSDITHRKNAEKMLRDSESRFRKLYENSPVAYQSLDADGCILEVNAAWLTTLGYERETVIGRWFGDFQVGEGGENFSKRFEAFKASGQIRGLELDLMKKNGEIITASFEGRVSRDAAGGFERTHCVFVNISERKRNEETLRRLMIRQDAILSAVPDIIMEVDMNKVYTWANSAGIAFFGPDVLGRSATDYFEGDQNTYEIVQPLFDGKEDVIYVESWQRRKDGEKRLLAWWCKVIKDEAGNPVGGLSTARDITDQHLLKAQLIQAQKMESVGRLAGGVAHDFNNMLSVILGYTELALDKIPEKDPLREDLDEVMQAANRSTDIARQLLAFARRQTISPKVMDLNETVEEMLKMLRRLIGEDIDLSWQPGGGLWPVNMDPSQIDQIMANLCVNSRDAIGGVGKITIETENVTLDKDDCAHRDELMPGDYVLLVVSDTGRGMDAATRERIFEPFFTTKGVGEGTGLGLSTIYGIVKQNKGDIQVYSEPGDGTTFRIYLPRHVGETHSVPDREVPRMLMGQGETVLVAEDEDAILKLAARMLERLGYTVLMAAGPVVAEQVAKTHAGPIDLLMTDVVMPDMSGRDLADRLSILYPDLRVLYMSGYTANVIAHRGVLEENMQFISKPFSQMDLARKVREALE